MPNHKRDREYVRFQAKLNDEGLLSLWCNFDTLKRHCEVINGKWADLDGGFVRTKDLEIHAKRLKVKKDTLRKKLSQMVKEEWAIKKRTGFQLVSWKKVAAKYGFNLKQRMILGHNKKTFRQNATYAYIRSSINQKVHRRFQELNRKERIVKKELIRETKLALINNPSDEFNFAPSVREIARNIGLKSARSVSTINQNLEARGLIEMEKRNAFACMTENYPIFIKGQPEFEGHCFRSKNDKGLVVLRRLKQFIFLK